MRTRNADKPKPSPAAKPTPAAKKSAVKTPQKTPEPSAESSATPKSSGTKRTRAIQAKNKQTQNISTPIVEEAATPPQKKPATVKKVTRVVKKKVVRKKTPSSAKSSKSDDAYEDELSKEEEGEDFVNEEPVENKEVIPVNVKEPAENKEVIPVNVEEPAENKEVIPANVEEPVENKEVIPVNVEEPSEKKEVIPANVEEPTENKEVIPVIVEEPVENKKVFSVDVDMKEASAGIVGQSPEKEDIKDMGEEGSENKEAVLVNAEEYKSTEPLVEHVEESVKEDVVPMNQDVVDMEGVAVGQNFCAEDAGICQVQKDDVAKDEDLTVMEEVNTLTSEEPVTMKEEEEVKKVTEITETVEVRTDATSEPVNLDEINTGMIKEDEPSEQADMEHVEIKTEAKEVTMKTLVVEGGIDTAEPVHTEKIAIEELKGDETFEQVDKKIEEQAGEDVSEEVIERVCAQDDGIEHGEKGSEEEHVELTAIAEERRRRKELEIFVGGLDRDAVDEDVRKVFQHIGEIVEVQVHKDASNSKNKGYAFVKFATKELAKQALAEIKNPVINGKRCGTAPCEDNDTLFLGNICNTWTKEAIRQKLKDFGIDGVETITLVSDPKHEGLSRGFAFIEFSCHGDAMLAYNRLQKPDVIFGHLERTAKVAFAKPLREPDPEVMAQVKSVFVDGLPPHWTEDQVRVVFKGYGDIEQITLASNISSSKRKDFGFVDFTTHEAAVACIDDVNSREVGEGNLKAKVKARLSNPLPKTQAVKGEMCGGFRIGRVDSSNITHPGRVSGRGAYSFSRTNSLRGRDFSHHGHGQTSRPAFPHSHGLGEPFRGTGSFGQGRWGSSRGAHVAPGEGSIAARINVDRPRHGAMDRVQERHMHFRGQPFSPEEFGRPFPERRFDDPYLYNDRAHGTKRPHYTYQDPRFMEPSRVRPRLDYTDPAISFHGPPHRDTYGSGSNPYPRDYYGPNSNPYSHDYYGPNVRSHGSVQYSGRGDIRPPFYGGARPHRGGYYH